VWFAVFMVFIEFMRPFQPFPAPDTGGERTSTSADGQGPTGGLFSTHAG
jgi:hypothetical protein